MQLSRRRFLALSAGLAVAASCGDDGTTSTTTTATAADDSLTLFALGQFFPQDRFAVTGSEQRLPIGVIAKDGSGSFPVTLEQAPPALALTIAKVDGEIVAELTVEPHGDGLPRAYYPVTATFAEPGLHTISTEFDGNKVDLFFQVRAAGEIDLLRPGRPAPALATPTFEAPRGVKVVCSREPPCDFHATTVEAALADRRPVALLVSSPAFCQTQVCGPVLEILIDAARSVTGVAFVHAEPYVDPRRPPTEWTPAPTTDALGLDYEPALFVIGADGVVARRLDLVFDAGEVRGALDAVAS